MTHSAELDAPARLEAAALLGLAVEGWKLEQAGAAEPLTNRERAALWVWKQTNAGAADPALRRTIAVTPAALLASLVSAFDAVEEEAYTRGRHDALLDHEVVVVDEPAPDTEVAAA